MLKQIRYSFREEIHSLGYKLRSTRLEEIKTKVKRTESKIILFSLDQAPRVMKFVQESILS